ncbi:MAG TPA: hypothetical protein VGK39_03205 [Cyclobacteriaceae bacterium]
MKKYTFIVVGAILLAACSSPKYTYYFDHYDYAKNKKGNSSQEAVVRAEQPTQESVLAIDERALTASANENEPVLVEPTTPAVANAPSNEEMVVKLKSMSKEERKEMKKEVKRFVKENKKEIKSGNAAKAMENDVKLAAIFGAIGIVLLIIGGDVLYILGAVALLVGLYFFIRWLMRN